MHELGHTFWRTHGGDALIDAPQEPNCKPNYFSVMSYMFQLTGLVSDDGTSHLDYARSRHQSCWMRSY